VNRVFRQYRIARQHRVFAAAAAELAGDRGKHFKVESGKAKGERPEVGRLCRGYGVPGGADGRAGTVYGIPGSGL